MNSEPVKSCRSWIISLGAYRLRAADVVFHLVVLVQLPPQGVHLTALKAGDPRHPPSLGSPEHGGEHELEHRLLAEGVGNYVEINIMWSNSV